MFCAKCGCELPDGSAICSRCGALTRDAGVAGRGGVAKSRTVYILFGVLLGFFFLPGIHNLYAGYIGRGLTQLLLTVCTCWILWLPIYIWAIVEVCTVEYDSDGNRLV